MPPELRAGGLALVGTGQALARFAFGALWTACGDQTALALAAGGLALSAALAARMLRPDRTSTEPRTALK